MRVFPVRLVEPRAPAARIWFDDWHDARRGSARHEAQDIFAPRGSIVVAPEAGIVTGVAVSPKGGRTVHVRSRQPDGSVRRYYFAHLDEQLVSKGDRVMAGSALGTVGNTGNATNTRPHLHLQVTRFRDGVRLYVENVFPELAELHRDGGEPPPDPSERPAGAAPLRGAVGRAARSSDGEADGGRKE